MNLSNFKFTLENMSKALKTSILSTLKLLGFSFPTRSLDLQKVENFQQRKEKYNYFDDDVDHDNFFNSNS